MEKLEKLANIPAMRRNNEQQTMETNDGSQQ
jgi:hypothetical protein